MTVPIDELIIRELQRTDVDAVSAIEAVQHPDAWPASTFHDVLDHGPDRYAGRVVINSDETLVAYAIVSFAGEVADLDNLTVRPESTGRGIGRWLLDRMINIASARGAVEMLLEVRHDNDPAIALYRSSGFVDISRRIDYYAPGSHALVLRRDLVAVRHG